MNSTRKDTSDPVPERRLSYSSDPFSPHPYPLFQNQESLANTARYIISPTPISLPPIFSLFITLSIPQCSHALGELLPQCLTSSGTPQKVPKPRCETSQKHITPSPSFPVNGQASSSNYMKKIHMLSIPTINSVSPLLEPGGVYGELCNAATDIFQAQGIGPLTKWVDDHVFLCIPRKSLPAYNKKRKSWHKEIMQNFTLSHVLPKRTRT